VSRLRVTGAEGERPEQAPTTGGDEPEGGVETAGAKPPTASPAAAAGPGDVFTPVAGTNLGAVLDAVFQVIKERQATRPEGSYTARLFNDGVDKILKKIGEEASETIIAAKNDSRHEILYEMADLYYHTLVLLGYYGLEPGQLAAELAARR